MDLILIHGIGQQGQDPIELQAVWEAALEKGWAATGLTRPSNVMVRFPFYGDELDRLTKQLAAPMPSGVLARGELPEDYDAELLGEIVEELAVSAEISDETIRGLLAPGQPVERGPQNWAWVQATLRALDGTFGAVAISLFLRDVHAYIGNTNVRQIIDGMVEKRITGASCVVVGHSLGSVVGYNVLRKLGASTKAVRYVTLGSPLAIKPIRRRVQQPLAMPAGIKDWLNAYDDRDVVALRPLDAKSFPIKPPIVNKSDVKNYTDNRHGIVGYLDDPVVAKWIHEALV
jgi:hypothetical protein